MGSLRRITGDKAGPTALGILIPPGQRTLLILRPRAVDWDLVLLLRPDGAGFRELARDQAAAGAQAVLNALEAWAGGGAGTVEPVAGSNHEFHVRAIIGPFPFLACPRLPGRPYQPLVCADLEAAHHAARALTEALCPTPGCEREVYLNTSCFSR